MEDLDVFLRNITLCLLLAANGALYADFLDEIDIPACPADRNLSCWYTERLCQEQNRRQEEILGGLGIQKADWEAKKAQQIFEHYNFCRNAVKENLSEKPLPQEIVQPACDLLKSKKVKKMLGIITIDVNPRNNEITVLKNDGKTIKLLCANDSLEADAATDHFHILLNPDVLLATHKNSAEIKATIAHELIHILYEDVLDNDCLDKLLCQAQQNRVKIPRRRFIKLRAAWERGQETRADILSGLIDFELAQAHEAHFLRNKPKRRKKLKTKSVHPTDWQRHAYMKQVVNAMKAQKNRPQYSYTWLFLLFALSFFILIATKHTSANRHNKSIKD